MDETPETTADPHAARTVDDLATLAALFGTPGAASIRKEVDRLHPVYRRWIEASPFAVLATSGPGGLDVSPRGDPAPLVAIDDAHTLFLPERRGNQRVDSLRNIVADPRVALLFLVPGVGETLRVSGRARIRVDDALLARFVRAGQRPVCVVEVRVERVLFQCARALHRSSLWAGDPGAPRPDVPTAGEMLAALTSGEVGGADYDRDLPQRQRDTLY